MMSGGDIEIRAVLDSAEARRLMKQLSGKRLHQALSVAVNDSARQVERKAEQLTARTLSIRRDRAALGIWIRPFSTPETLTAVVKGSGSEIPLKAFGARQTEGGVTARIWGGSSFHPGAFIFGGPDHDRTRDLNMGGHVFTRVGSKRFPIRKAKGAAISEAMAQDAVSRANEAHAAERLQVNVMRQLARYARSSQRARP